MRLTGAVQFLITVQALLLTSLLPPASATQFTYFHDMEYPMDWSDLNMEWGFGGKIDYACEEPGYPGKAMHGTVVPILNDPDPCANFARGALSCSEGRCLQFNHKPGTAATIAFDFAVFGSAPGAFVKVRHYDGYVTADAFVALEEDPFYAFPPAIVHWTYGSSGDWQHYEVTTEVLENPVLTLWIYGESAAGINFAIDNLAITVELSEVFYDPGFDWGSNGGQVAYDKMNNWRYSVQGKWQQWCDMMYVEYGPRATWDPTLIFYGSMNLFRDTASSPPGLGLKHDYWRRAPEAQAGGNSVIGFASIHGDAQAKSMGLRQTSSYSAWGLVPNQPAHVIVQCKGTSTFKENWDGPGARTLLGVDPYGGVVSHHPDAIWTEEQLTELPDEWAIHRIEFDKPPEAKALTVWIKWRDGQKREDPSDCDDRGIAPGNEGWFDWVLVQVTPRPTWTLTPSPIYSYTPTPTPFPDADGDGIMDSLESRAPDSGQTNVYLPDSDGDGLGDGVEDANRDGSWEEGSETNPRSRDTDGDSFEDKMEEWVLGEPLDPQSPGWPFADADGDNLPDILDPAYEEADSDGDRFSDGYEAVSINRDAVTDSETLPPLADVDENQNVDNGDSQRILNFFARIPQENMDPSCGDADRDGFIDNADAQQVLNYFARVIPDLPAE